MCCLQFVGHRSMGGWTLGGRTQDDENEYEDDDEEEKDDEYYEDDEDDEDQDEQACPRALSLHGAVIDI